MHITLVEIEIKPEFVNDFVKACERNYQGTRREPGNIRFDVLQAADKPAHWVLYEVFATAEDAAAHKQTPHYKAWREKVEAWMARPRKGQLYVARFPSERKDW